MAKYLMMGKYTQEAVKGITAERTRQGTAVIEKAGGKVNAAYALLGDCDLMLLVDLPGTAEVMKVSLALTKLTGISFTSYPAVSMEEFDRILS